jgi:predicted secreted Zn-dependent protease
MDKQKVIRSNALLAFGILSVVAGFCSFCGGFATEGIHSVKKENEAQGKLNMQWREKRIPQGESCGVYPLEPNVIINVLPANRSDLEYTVDYNRVNRYINGVEFKKHPQGTVITSFKFRASRPEDIGKGFEISCNPIR